MSREWAEKALDAAVAAGCVEAEVFISNSTSVTVDAREQDIETFSVADAAGAGLRVITRDRRLGFAYASARAEAPEALAAQAVENAAANDPDEHNVLPANDTVSDDDWSRDDFSAVPVEEKRAFALRLEELALRRDPRIERVQVARYADGGGDVYIANTHGMRRRFRHAACTCTIGVQARDGDQAEMGYEVGFSETFAGLDPETVSERGAHEALRKLGGTPCTTRRMPVVLDRDVVRTLLGVLAPALAATQVLKGKSLFAGRVGEAVASDQVTVVDQPDHPEGWNRQPFDGEGVAAGETRLIEGGVLRGYLQNAYSAHKMSAPNTGNGVRGGYQTTPSPGPANCYVVPGEASVDDLLAAAGDGFLMYGAMGAHTADPVSGQFSFGAEGVRIRDGRRAEPVRGVTVAGEITSLLRDIRLVADDMRFVGAFGAPSVLVGALPVSGT